MLPSDFVSKGTAPSCCCRGGVEHLQAGMCLGMLNMMLCPHRGWQGLASCGSHPLHLSGSLVHPLSLLEGTGVRTSVFSASAQAGVLCGPPGPCVGRW